MAKKTHYISNKDMYKAFVDWNNARAVDPATPLPEYIGECFCHIAKNLGRKPNFNGYTYLDDMIGDAVLLCVRYARSFNPEKSQNPFSYFTSMIYHEFIAKIKKEKKSQVIKKRAIDEVIKTGTMIDDCNSVAEIKDSLSIIDDKEEDRIVDMLKGKQKPKKKDKGGLF